MAVHEVCSYFTARIF